ncbi:hypothetical protein Vadar_025864 [Vaccinium darrowii]|uniref:Uncharacterized protein n=1 Tax=Vaccinium darrowii TaxID=229202 RepID=A0ACB7YZ05_9ERIC|nr:hypothetical protein Vadar_025864 [Vaccinium darrowii]
MDSIKIFKGYNILPNPNIPNQPSTTTTTPTTTPKPCPHRNPLTTTVALSLILLLTLTLAAALVALIYESTTEAPDSPSESLNAVCSLTPHPRTCFTSISSLTFNSSLADPELIFTLSLRASLDQLKNLTSLPKTLISKSNDRRSESALRDCESLFGDAVSRLGDSVRAVEVGAGERVLDEGKIGDLMTWISGAMTYQETCLDGLEEMGSTVLGEVRVKVQKSKEYLSNSLAILANMQSLLQKFHLTMH